MTGHMELNLTHQIMVYLKWKDLSLFIKYSFIDSWNFPIKYNQSDTMLNILALICMAIIMYTVLKNLERI